MTPKPSDLKISDTEWSGLSEGARKLFVNMHDRLKKRTDSGEEDSKPFDLEGKDGGISDAITQVAERNREVVKTFREMRKAGMDFAFDPIMQRGISQVIAQTDTMIGSTKVGAEAFKSLSRQLKNFHQLSKQTEFDKVTNQTVGLTSALSTQAGLLNQLGLSFEKFSANVDSAIYSFGLNAQQVQKFNFDIKDLADSLKMLPNEVSKNFQLVSKSLAYDLTGIKQQFVEFQKLSLKTGIGVQTLTQGFGQKMDTIGGASSAAASINMLLGRNAFSATEILMMDDATRAKKVREAIVKDPAIMADIAKGGAAGKFALRTVAETLNMDVDTARRFITTGDDKSVKAAVAGQIDADVGTAESQKFTKSVGKLSDAVDTAVTDIHRSLSRFRSIQIKARGEEINRARREGASALQAAGITADLGIMPEGVTNQMVATAMLRSNAGEDLIRVIKDIQKGTLRKENLPGGQDPAKFLRQLLADLSRTGASPEDIKARADARARMATAITTSGKDVRIEKRLSQLGEGFRAGLDTLFSTNEFAARVLLREIAGPEGMFQAFQKSDAFTDVKRLGEMSIQDRKQALKSGKFGQEKVEGSFLQRLLGLKNALSGAKDGKKEQLEAVERAANKLAMSDREEGTGPFKIRPTDRARQRTIEAEVTPLGAEGTGTNNPKGLVVAKGLTLKTSHNHKHAVTVTVVDKSGKMKSSDVQVAVESATSDSD